MEETNSCWLSIFVSSLHITAALKSSCRRLEYMVWTSDNICTTVEALGNSPSSRTIKIKGRLICFPFEWTSFYRLFAILSMRNNNWNPNLKTKIITTVFLYFVHCQIFYKKGENTKFIELEMPVSSGNNLPIILYCVSFFLPPTDTTWPQWCLTQD
jgi:hypothetical protein